VDPFSTEDFIVKSVTIKIYIVVKLTKVLIFSPGFFLIYHERFMPGVCSPVDQCSIMYQYAAALVINPFMKQTFPKYLNNVTVRLCFAVRNMLRERRIQPQEEITSTGEILSFRPM
jgi:hypothetical protein